MRVKICGVTQVDQALAIASHGPHALGFICVPESSRYIPPDRISAITSALASLESPPDTVGVFANADVAAIQATVHTARLTTVQLHGSESPDVCQHVRAVLPTIRLIKALRIRASSDLNQAFLYSSCADALLLDAYHPQLLGGSGKTLDWRSLQSFKPTLPWFLAGGLTPENVVEALSQLEPDGIDLSSGVEVSPGVKDLGRVQELFSALAPWLSPAGMN